MINSLFFINTAGDIFLEKHYKVIVYRSVCDYFFEEVTKATTAADVPPIIQTPNHFLISIFRAGLHFLAVCKTEVPPLFVIEFLHRLVDTIKDYFDDVSESVIKDNIVIVYEILDEMLDNGFPLATESNILKELIRPPNLLRTITDTVTGKNTTVSATLPTGQLSNIPWRRIGVRYANNEAYFDIVEELDAIIDKSGGIVAAEVFGHVDCMIKLSGMPDLTLSFVNPRLIEDVGLHPCIRYKRWENERVISFIPPDGNFRLFTYRVGPQNSISIPLSLRHSIIFRENSSRLELSLSPRQTTGKPIDDLQVEIRFPKAVSNLSLSPSQGKYTFDPNSKTMTWTIGKLDSNKIPSIRGPITLQSGLPVPDSSLTVFVQFNVTQLAVSGLKVNRLDLFGEKYKPFKGVKYITKAGRFEFRT